MYLELNLHKNPTITWHRAHYPLPRCLGGQEEINLLEADHAVQGVLQSEAYGHDCIYGWEADYLDGELLALHHKWMQYKGRRVGKTNANKASSSWDQRKEQWDNVCSAGGKARAGALHAKGITSWGFENTTLEHRILGGEVSSRILYKCPQCSMKCNAGNMTRHMKSSGHAGERIAC